jgi:hypothetical protein
MKEHSVSIEIARKKIEDLKEDTWKDFNHEWLNPDNAVLGSYWRGYSS